MKRIVFYFIGIMISLSLIGCSEEPPSLRVRNERPTKANVQIKTVNNTINHNDVQPGAVTNFQDVAEGKVEITAEIQNESVSPVAVFITTNDHNYTILITGTNPPVLKIDVADK